MATTISRDDALHLAQLSNIQLTDEELATLQTDLGTILDYINELGELDTTGVEPTYQVTDLQNVMRDDVVSIHSADREALLKLAPEKADNSIKVPKVL
jgi:aspartyl-tRNA(Asn)/glutamyl-tRNA(Gln) amidotransferase subunit C